MRNGWKIFAFSALRSVFGLAGLAVFVMAVRSGMAFDWKTLKSAFLFSLLSGAFTVADHYYAQAKYQWAVDLDPRAIVESVSRDGRSYCLVLRGFAHDAEVALPNDFNPFQGLPVGFGMPMVDVQEWLMRAAGPQWRFFSWGGKLGAVRPVRIRAGEDWFPGVQEAIRRAGVVFIVPGGSESLLKEIDFALAEAPQRLVFVFPPRAANGRLYYALGKSVLLSGLAQAVPEEGALVTPHPTAAGEPLRFEARPLQVRHLQAVLGARSQGSADPG